MAPRVILDVNDIHTGLELSLKESITKNSPVLKKDALFEKQSLISEFPEYLLVNFTRFFWKAKEGIKAKILRVIFQRGSTALYFLESQFSPPLEPLHTGKGQVNDDRI